MSHRTLHAATPFAILAGLCASSRAQDSISFPPDPPPPINVGAVDSLNEAMDDNASIAVCRVDKVDITENTRGQPFGVTIRGQVSLHRLATVSGTPPQDVQVGMCYFDVPIDGVYLRWPYPIVAPGDLLLYVLVPNGVEVGADNWVAPQDARAAATQPVHWAAFAIVRLRKPDDPVVAEYADVARLYRLKGTKQERQSLLWEAARDHRSEVRAYLQVAADTRFRKEDPSFASSLAKVLSANAPATAPALKR